MPELATTCEANEASGACQVPSLRAHVAFGQQRLERADDELWTAVDRLSDWCQKLDAQLLKLDCSLTVLHSDERSVDRRLMHTDVSMGRIRKELRRLSWLNFVMMTAMLLVAVWK
jgi:hypothetical protein